MGAEHGFPVSQNPEGDSLPDVDEAAIVAELRARLRLSDADLIRVAFGVYARTQGLIPHRRFAVQGNTAVGATPPT